MKRVRPEDEIQRAVCQLLDIYQNQKKLSYFAVPNGGKRSKIEAGIMKGLGVKAGVPDLCVLITRGPSLYIELKADEGRVSANQEAWIDWINNAGGQRYAHVCRSVQEVHTVIKWGFAHTDGTPGRLQGDLQQTPLR